MVERFSDRKIVWGIEADKIAVFQQIGTVKLDVRDRHRSRYLEVDETQGVMVRFVRFGFAKKGIESQTRLKIMKRGKWKQITQQIQPTDKLKKWET